jgi:hypothetical protein
MTIEVTGGLIEDWEYVWAHQPGDPEARESVNAWIWDDSGSFGIPRMGVEAVADQWDTHDIQVNLAFADGRVFNVFGNGTVHNPLGADGRARILGAGPLSFEMVEPYRHLRVKLDGEAIATTVEAQMAGWTPWTTPSASADGGDRVAVKAQIDIRPILPPWENGSTSEEAHRILSTQEEGYLIGYPWRFEQLCSASGSITIGNETRGCRQDPRDRRSHHDVHVHGHAPGGRRRTAIAAGAGPLQLQRRNSDRNDRTLNRPRPGHALISSYPRSTLRRWPGSPR